MSFLMYLADFLIYPGLVFAFVVGWFFYWLFRKLRARMQYRRGPPWFQPFADIIKLLSKSSIVPKTAHRKLFVWLAVVLFVSIWATLMFIPAGSSSAPIAFFGDLIALLYLLLIPPLVFVACGPSSSSPYGSIGSNREVVLMLAYESAFTIAIISIAFMTRSLSLSVIVGQQSGFSWLIFRNPFAAAAIFLCLVGKLHLKPFDIPEAEQEIVAGTVTEYSGKFLGLIEISRTLLWYIAGVLFADLFLGGGDGLPPPWCVIDLLIKASIVVFTLTIVNVASARYRIDQAFTWYLKIPIPLSLIGLALAFVIGG